MADILKFLPRDEYEQVKWERIAARVSEVKADDALNIEMTSKELYDLYSEEVVNTCSHLIDGFKRSGNWTPDCNLKMKQIFHELMNVARMLAVNTAKAPTNLALTLEDPLADILTIPIGVQHDANIG
jgi:hypothetical protein